MKRKNIDWRKTALAKFNRLKKYQTSPKDPIYYEFKGLKFTRLERFRGCKYIFLSNFFLCSKESKDKFEELQREFTEEKAQYDNIIISEENFFKYVKEIGWLRQGKTDCGMQDYFTKDFTIENDRKF